MTETTPDWGVLAAALVADGQRVRDVYEEVTTYGCAEHGSVTEENVIVDSGLRCPVCGRQLDLHDGRQPHNLPDLAIIVPRAEAWRQRDEARRSYRMRSIGVGVAAHAAVNDAGHSYEAKAVDDPASVAEALARALLAWAEAQEAKHHG